MKHVKLDTSGDEETGIVIVAALATLALITFSPIHRTNPLCGPVQDWEIRRSHTAPTATESLVCGLVRDGIWETIDGMFLADVYGNLVRIKP